jgi:hypothetical protein
MTLPAERTRAVLNTRDWLLDRLSDAKPWTKNELRADIRALLRHYPGTADFLKPCKAFAPVKFNDRPPSKSEGQPVQYELFTIVGA